jgi:Ca2+-binding EF-hand superfamily protein
MTSDADTDSFARNVFANKKFNPTNPKDLIELVCAFARIDQNSDGKLSKNEFEELFKLNNMSLNDLDAFVIFNL